MSRTKGLAKVARGLLPMAIGVATAAAALGAYAATAARHHQRNPSLWLSANPAHVTVAPGGVAHYPIVVHRQYLGDLVRMDIRGVPRHAGIKLVFLRQQRWGIRHPKKAWRTASLSILTSLKSPPGNYPLEVHAFHGGAQATTVLTLTIDPPRAEHFTAAGDAVSPLWPGIPQALDIALANPNVNAIAVTHLNVAITGLTAPRATRGRPCSLGDFAVQQYTGPYPIAVPALASRTLRLAGIAQTSWPQLEIINRPLDQDGCQGATLTLSYSGSAISQ